jgi:hypothetical protein
MMLTAGDPVDDAVGDTSGDAGNAVGGTGVLV